MREYIAYYRVSTDRQGASGLGLDAQRAAVAAHVKSAGQLVTEYTEIESGRRHTNRPKLLAALAECRKRQAVLLIAKLDRLARNVAFISNLMESGVDFIACDMPEPNRTGPSRIVLPQSQLVLLAGDWGLSLWDSCPCCGNRLGLSRARLNSRS